MADPEAPFRFYAAEVSYFSGKVRPALRAKGIPFVELLPDYLNALPATLRPLLDLVGRDAAPWILDGVWAFESWADARPGAAAAAAADAEEPPRFTGRIASALCGASAERFVSSYTLWMLQRVLDAQAALAPAARATS